MRSRILGLAFRMFARRRSFFRRSSIGHRSAIVGVFFLPARLGYGETLTIPAYGIPVVQSAPLEPGRTYLVEVTGTYVFDVSNGRQADAEWSNYWGYLGDPTWFENPRDENPSLPEPDPLDLLIDGAPVDWLGTADGANFAPHTYSPNHTYRYLVVGAGVPIVFQIADPGASQPWDNAGSLTVSLCAQKASVTDACDNCANWTERSPATSPSARRWPGMAYDSARGVTVLFGGLPGVGDALGDTWEWNGTSWTQRSPAASPPARYNHSMTYDSARGVIVLFGGASSSPYMFLDDTWEWDGMTWTHRSPATSPPERAGFAMAYDSVRSVTVLFGGSYENSGFRGDTWEWNGTNWMQRSPAISPLARYSHSMAFDSARGVTVLFGGQNNIGPSFLSETWEWNGTTWMQRSPATSPPALGYHRVTYNSTSGVTVLFGGVTYPYTFLIDTWEWDGATWMQRSPETSPPGRYGHDMAYDSAHGATVLFGGYNDYGNIYFGDTWEYGPCSEPQPCVAEVAKLIGSHASTNDLVTAVDVDGDFIVIGSPWEDWATNRTGTAYVFRRGQDGSWNQVAQLLAGDGAWSDAFGGPVSISAGTVIVGAPEDDDLGGASGSAYIFGRNFGGADAWGQVKKLLAADGTGGDTFGLRVGISGDMAIAGAPGNDGVIGAAYIFERDTGGANNWGLVKKLTAPDGQPNDAFGWWVSIDGDTAIIGALQDDVAGTNSGSVYIFERNSGGADNWGLVKKLAASDATPYALFGHTVSISGDVAIVGAIHVYDPQDSPGAGYIFSRNEGGPNNWGQVTKLTASDAFDGDEFGRGVAIDGGLAIVSASRDNFPSDGALYVFKRDNGVPNTWTEIAKVTPSDLGPDDKFGHWVALDGLTAVIGSYKDDHEGGVDAGSAYVFSVDCNDGCPSDPNKTAPGVCGCGIPDLDSDDDGTVDCDDGCANDPNKTTPGICGCGESDAIGFVGFLPPIAGADANGGTFADPLRAFKLGSTIPVKFMASQCGGPLLTGVHTLQAVKYSNAVDSDPAIDATPTDAATTGNQFRLTDGEWHFNLSTRTEFSTGTWKLIATLSDGSQHYVWITIKK